MRARHAPLAALVATLLGGAVAGLAVLAAAAALVASHDRRHRASGLAAGMAALLAPAGLIVLPVLLGAALPRRSGAGFVAALAAGAAVTLALAGSGWAAAPLVAWSDAWLDLRALAAATAAGLAGWIAATAAARPLRPREVDALALAAGAILPLLLPIGAAPWGLAIVLLMAGAHSRDLPRRAANDDPLPLRA